VDNVPGAPGIGIKTAALLINEFGSLDELLDRAEEVPQPKRRQTLLEKREQIELSRRLVQLDCDMTLDFGLKDLEVRDPDADALLGFLSEMEFRTLTKRIADRMGVAPPSIAEPAVTQDAADTPDAPPIDASKYECVRDVEALQVWIDRAHKRGWIAVDTETTGLNEMTADLGGVCLSVEPGEACYIPLTHRKGSSDDLVWQ